MDLAEGPIGVEGCGFLGKNPGDHLDAVGTQPLFSPGCHRVGIRLGDDNPGNPGVDQGMAARSGTPGVMTGLQGDDGGGPLGIIASLAQCLHLSVWSSRSAVPTLTYHPVLSDNDTADTRVRIGHGDFAAISKASTIASSHR